MNRRFKRTKIIITFFILLSTCFVSICSIVNSGPLDQIYEITPNIIIDYDESLLQEHIMPFEEARSIPVDVKLTLFGPALDIVLSKISGMELIVDMSIAEVPEGCQASVTPPILLIPIPEDESPVSVNATISITLNQYIPALSHKMVTVRMSSRRFGGQTTLIKPGNYTQDFPFIVGYYSQLSFVYSDGNIRNISPDETADFNFEIQNLGNSATKVISEVEDLPEGWISEIVGSTVLGSKLVGSTSSETISLRVKPPIDFGYHEDRAVIKVSMTPVNYDNQNFRGEPHYLYFIVQSKGFFTPGFELVIILLAFIFLIPVLKSKKRGGKR
jgi:hypothetical protein